MIRIQQSQDQDQDHPDSLQVIHFLVLIIPPRTPPIPLLNRHVKARPWEKWCRSSINHDDDDGMWMHILIIYMEMSRQDTWCLFSVLDENFGGLA